MVATYKRHFSRMAVKTYWWISLWFALTAPLIIYDASFCLLRPRGYSGGDLYKYFSGYDAYTAVDLLYSQKIYKTGETHFLNIAAVMNLLETLSNISYLVLVHVSQSPTAPIVGFSGALVTFAKTIMYVGQEAFCNGCTVGHNKIGPLLQWWLIPNSLWLIFPFSILLRLGSDMAQALRITAITQNFKKTQ